MQNEDSVLLRRQVLDWRDRHIEHVNHHLNREILLLFNALDKKIEKMSIADVYKGDLYTKKHLSPFYTHWINHEVSILIGAAQADLNKICKYALEYQKRANTLNHGEDNNSAIDTTTAVFSGAAAVASIPTLLSLATVTTTTTASVGGVLGLLGVTSTATVTAVSLPFALLGLTVVGGLFTIGGYKATNIRSNAIKRNKKKIRESISKLVIYNNNHDSVCESLQVKINEVASAFLSELHI